MDSLFDEPNDMGDLAPVEDHLLADNYIRKLANMASGSRRRRVKIPPSTSSTLAWSANTSRRSRVSERSDDVKGQLNEAKVMAASLAEDTNKQNNAEVHALANAAVRFYDATIESFSRHKTVIKDGVDQAFTEAKNIAFWGMKGKFKELEEIMAGGRRSQRPAE